MQRNFLRTLFLVAGLLCGVSLPAAPLARLVWDRQTLVLVQPGGVYGRMARLPDRAIQSKALRKRRLSVRGPRFPFLPPGIKPFRRSH